MKKKSKPKPPTPFHGRWLIESMTEWDRAFIDEEVRGYFEFRSDGSGSFQFGYVQGEIDFRPTTRDGKPCIEFTWDGNDEMDPAQGRGWAALKGGKLDGKLYFHGGDESGFVLNKTRRKMK